MVIVRFIFVCCDKLHNFFVTIRGRGGKIANGRIQIPHCPNCDSTAAMTATVWTCKTCGDRLPFDGTCVPSGLCWEALLAPSPTPASLHQPLRTLRSAAPLGAGISRWQGSPFEVSETPSPTSTTPNVSFHPQPLWVLFVGVQSERFALELFLVSASGREARWPTLLPNAAC